MRSSLALKIGLAVAALTVLTALVTTGFAIVSTDGEVRGDVDKFLEERAKEILENNRSRPGRNDRPDNRANDRDDDGGAVVQANLPAVAELDAQVQTLDEDGVVTASTGLAIPVNEKDLALADKEGDDVFRSVDIDGVEYRVLTSHIPGGGALQVARSLDSTTTLIDVIRNQLLAVGGGLALVIALVGWLMARRALEPLGELTTAAERVAATQDLDTPIAVDGRGDEIGRLATSFNEMLGALATSREQQHRLVQDAAHELRTPLTSVNANIDLLTHAPDLPETERQEILTGVRAELRQMGVLFTEIIELATDNRTAADHEPLDLADVVRSAIDELARRADNPVDAELVPSPVVGESAALHRAVTNLLSNAVKYGPPGAPIGVRVQGGTVAVSDRGPGIAPADRARIFDRFHRGETARSQPGSGLGLAIVAKIVADHGGRTFVDDAEPGPGAVVGFTLPR